MHEGLTQQKQDTSEGKKKKKKAPVESRCYYVSRANIR